MTKRKEIYKIDDIVASTSSDIENHVKAVYYKSLSANTQNSLEIIQIENPDISILHRHQLIPFEEKELEKIDHALTLGINETCKDLNERSYLRASFNKSNRFENLNKKGKKLAKYEEDPSTRIKKELEFVFDDHLIELDDFIRRYETNVSGGLNDEQVQLRLKRDGKNLLKKRKNKPVIVRWLIEVFGGYNIIMWLATILCFLCWQPLGGDNPSVYNLVLTIFLFAVIMIQSTVSFIQQFRSDNLMASFEKLMPLKSSVLRNGKWDDVNSSDLVVGDVVRMSSGDKIPADLRIIDCQQASIDKSCLTGESEPVKLNLFKIESNPYETKNIAMFGSLLMEGTMIGIVFQTGEKTIMAKIASLAMNAKGEITTMQREINYFAVIIGSMSIGTGLLTFIIWLTAIKPQHPNFFDYSGIISTCIGVVISFFPEGLPMAVTMTLTLIAKKMKKANVLVKKMAIIGE
jgi:sodium/potassium-transporting ATPase subunit alpha